MRLAETLSVLKRRWYLVVAGVLLTAVGCFYVYDRVPTTYEAKGSVVLMPPSATVGDEGNPYLFLGGMGQALDVLTRHVNAAEIVEPILEDHPDTNYTIEPDRDTSGSIMQVIVTGPDPSTTMDVLHEALSTIPISLNAMQDELLIEDYLRIGLMTVVVDTEPTADQKQRLQLLIFAAVGGIVGTVLLTGMIDGMVLSLRREAPQKNPASRRKRPVGEADEGIAIPRPARAAPSAVADVPDRSRPGERRADPTRSSTIPRQPRKTPIAEAPTPEEAPATQAETSVSVTQP